MDTEVSLSHELTRCRERLQISQIVLAKMMNLKTHRLSDLEKARSFPSEAEAARVRRRLYQIMHDTQSKPASSGTRGRPPRIVGVTRGH